jgi:hypothetical protein
VLASIFVAIEVAKTANAPLQFRFSYRDMPTAKKPQVRSIGVDNVGQRESACVVEAIDGHGALIRDEWTMGQVPPNFRQKGCKPLTPGEYEAYVQADVGQGHQRFTIDRDGGVKMLPWDDLEEEWLRQRRDRGPVTRPQ